MISLTMPASELLSAIDYASVSAATPVDGRRVLSQEASALRARLQTGGNVAEKMREVAETARLWGVELADTIVEEMPDQYRASHRAAGNWGVYPVNGATRRRVTRAEADEIIGDDDDGYARIVGSTP